MILWLRTRKATKTEPNTPLWNFEGPARKRSITILSWLFPQCWQRNPQEERITFHWGEWFYFKYNSCHLVNIWTKEYPSLCFVRQKRFVKTKTWSSWPCVRPVLHKLRQHCWGTDSPFYDDTTLMYCTLNFSLNIRQHARNIPKHCFCSARKIQICISFISDVFNSHWTSCSYQEIETTLTYFIEAGSIKPPVSTKCTFDTKYERAARNLYIMLIVTQEGIKKVKSKS